MKKKDEFRKTMTAQNLEPLIMLSSPDVLYLYITCILYEVKKQGSYFPMLMIQLCKVRWLPLEMTITEALNGI